MKRRIFLSTSLLGTSGLFMKLFSNNILPLSHVTKNKFDLITDIQEIKPFAGNTWKFVSIPDFVNRDVPWPEPKLDGILGFVLDSIKSEDPEFVMVMGDMVNGRWWMPEDITLTKEYIYNPAIPDESTLAFHRTHLSEMAKLYHGGWVDRMKAHGLPFYVAVGDHEIGDNPWIGLKKPLVKDFQDVFLEYYRMPLNGPPGKMGLSYYVIHDNCLFIVLDPFEQDENGEVHIRISQEQQDWMEHVLQKTQNKLKFRIVGCHTPILTKGIRATASSKLTLPGETQAPLWQLMKKYDIDLYLCGEYHAISCQESDGILQLVHGALMGFSQYLNYLEVTVTPNSLLLEFKEIETVLEKPEGEPDRLSRIARISEAQMLQESKSIGKMHIEKASKGKIFTGKSGIFTEHYVRYTDNS